jgi:hypothetical protein
MARKNGSEYQPYRPVDEAFVRSTPTVFGGQVAPADADEEEQQTPTLKVVPAPNSAGGQNSRVKRTASKVKLNKYARYLTTDSEFRELERFASEFSYAAGTTIELGKLLRICNAVMLHAQKELIESVKAEAPLKRPRNDDPVGLADFEYRLSKMFCAAFQRTDLIG